MDATDEKIFKFAYRMALDDATRQLAYKGSDKIKLRGCSEAQNAVETYIEGIFEDSDESDFMTTVSSVMNAFKDYLKEESDGTFTFGNTQKLINMTAKYMFMSTYGRPELRSRFARCDCPMDSVLLERVTKEAAEAVNRGNTDSSLNEYLDKCAKQISRGENKGSWAPADDLKWSQLGFGDERYRLFQDAVRTLAASQSLIPIEYDFYEWA